MMYLTRTLLACSMTAIAVTISSAAIISFDQAQPLAQPNPTFVS